MVMQGLPDGFAAKSTPIAIRIREVKVPRLVDGIAGRQGRGADYAEEEKAAIFEDDAIREGGRPSILTGQAATEG